MKFVFPHIISLPLPYRGLARVVPLRQFRTRYGRLTTVGQLRAIVPVPFGWLVVREPHYDSVIIGPWWVLGWRWLMDHHYWRLCWWAVEHGWAEEPYESCYLNELRWFPKLRRRSRAT